MFASPLYLNCTHRIEKEILLWNEVSRSVNHNEKRTAKIKAFLDQVTQDTQNLNIITMEHVAIVCLTWVGTNHMFILQKHEKKIVRLSPACAPFIWVPLRIGLARCTKKN